jgi:hypothetical protein
MSKTLSTGSVFKIAATYGPVVDMTAITNATEAEATLDSGHLVVVGDILEVTSGWGRLNERLVRVKTVVSDDITFEEINTNSTTVYPPGSGVGSIRRVLTWVNLTQVNELSNSGGTQNFADGSDTDSVIDVQLPTTKAPVVMNFTCHDDPALPWYAACVAADEARAPYGYQMVSARGAVVLGNAYWSILQMPQVQKNQTLKTLITLTFAAAIKRYAT